MAKNKVVKGATDPNTADVVAGLVAAGAGIEVSKEKAAMERQLTTAEAQAHVARGEQIPRREVDRNSEFVSAMAPGLVRFIKVHRFPAGKIFNPDVPLEDLPTQVEVTDPVTNMPRKGWRFRTARGNARVDF